MKTLYRKRPKKPRPAPARKRRAVRRHDKRNQPRAKEAAGEAHRQWQKDLARRAKQGDTKAAGELVASVDAMIWQLCWRFSHGLARGSGRGRATEEDVQDMRNEARLALFSHIPNYDTRYAWTTYSIWWIRAAIQRYWNNCSRLVRIPVHLLDKQHKIVKAYQRFVKARGRAPTDDEWAAAANITPKSLGGIRVAWAQGRTVSLDAVVNPGENERTVSDLIADERESAESALLVEARDARLRAALNQLEPRYRFILEYRHGFRTGKSETLEDTAAALGAAGLPRPKGSLKKKRLTRERVRQIEVKAQKALRKVMGKMARRDE